MRLQKSYLLLGSLPFVSLSFLWATALRPALGRLSCPLETESVLRRLLHPISPETFLTEYWEKKPLVIRGRSPTHYGDIFSLDKVDEVIRNGVRLSDGSYPMEHGRDWKVLKRFFKEEDGEFWSALLTPHWNRASTSGDSMVSREDEDSGRGVTGEKGASGRTTFSLKEVHTAFAHGFSVVVNHLQRRWREVADVSLSLEEEMGYPVNVNMYLTPQGYQGFEAHFDWMDGLILQLSGEKSWRLFDQLVDLPRPSDKYKPRAIELGDPIAEFELRPGDLLYMPRGWPHEAATNSSLTVPGVSGARERKQGGGGGSLHLTFGVEVALGDSYESLLHHAIEAFAEEWPDLFASIPHAKEETARQLGTDGAQQKEGGIDDGMVWEGEEAGAGVGGLGKGEGASDGSVPPPWLEFLHTLLYNMGGTIGLFRRAVPLGPAFTATLAREGGSIGHGDFCTQRDVGDTGSGGEGLNRDEEVSSPRHVPSPVLLEEFAHCLKAFGEGATPDDLVTVLKGGEPEVGLDGGRGLGSIQPESATADTEGKGHAGGWAGGWEGAGDWGETARGSVVHLSVYDVNSLALGLKRLVDAFVEGAPVQKALDRMIATGDARRQARAERTEIDLVRCGQG